MSKLLSVVSETIEREQLLDAHQHVMVAISGGADSVALLMALHFLGYSVEAVHCNFGLRGGESDADEAFVRDLCAKHNISLRISHFDTTLYARDNNLSIEMAARELRYSWFEQLLSENCATKVVALAHHQNDQAETVLLNLSMGTGIRGVRGMKYIRDDKYVRPLLDVTRAEIEQFLQEKSLGYRTDSSNHSLEHTRNKIRLEIIPQFNDINPSFVKTVSRTAQNLQGVEALYDYFLEGVKKEVFCSYGIRIEKLKKYPAIPTLLHYLLAPYGFSRLQILDIAKSLTHAPGAVFYSQTHSLKHSRDFLELYTITSDLNNDISAISFNLPTDYRQLVVDIPLGKVVISRSKREAIKNAKRPPTNLLIDASDVSQVLTFRPIQEGDAMVPFGFRGSRKVRRILIDKHIPHSLRAQQMVLVDEENRILWIPGIITSNHHVLADNTQEIYLFEFESGLV